MNFAAILMAPLVLLLPGPDEGPGAPDGGDTNAALTAQSAAASESGQEQRHAAPPPGVGTVIGIPETWRRLVLGGSAGQSANQVRIEQRMTIRISPRPTPVQPDLFSSLPTRAIGNRFEERRIGKCLPISRISGVQTNGKHELILYLHDRRIISAQLERACRARDFYSGFYLARTGDGNLCVDRDTLLSRSGANCKLTSFRQLIEVED